MTACLDAAFAYLERGWSVLPAEAHGKRPLIAWRSLQQQRATRHAVLHWFEHWPDANVSIVTGSLSGLVVLDVDARHHGVESLAALEREHGALPLTPEVHTGGGGRHLYFRHPGIALANRVGMWPGIDLRGDGGCVVAPPSIHPSGQPYAWRQGRAAGDLPLADLPGWLLDAARRHAPRH